MEYAYRHALEYRAVFWIRAEAEEQITSSLLHIAHVLCLPEWDDQDQQQVFAAVQDWFTTHEQWLLIWDNVEDLASLDCFLPLVQRGAMLVTTRHQAVGTLAQSLDLLPMEEEEGMLFLLRRARILATEASEEQMQEFAHAVPIEYAAAGELVRTLGGLPLALDQAGAYIEETGCGLSGYLHRSTHQFPALLERRGNMVGAGDGRHPQSVAATFRLAYRQIEQEQHAATQILWICALLSSEAIPEELFVKGAPYLGSEVEYLASHPIQFDQTMAVLRNFSLIQRHAESRTFSMHRLVQEVLRESLGEAVLCEWSGRVVRALNAVFPEAEFASWNQCERYMLHAKVSSQLVKRVGKSVPEARELFLKVGEYALERGRYTEAQEFLTQNIFLEDQYEANDLIAAQTFDRLATLYWRKAEYQQAEQCFHRALTIGEQCMGVGSLEIATYLNNLSLLYFEQGEYQQAEHSQQRAVTIQQQCLNPHDPLLAQAYDNMARILEVQGKSTEAEQLYKRALVVWEQQPGPPPPNMTFCLNNLGVFYVKQQRYDLAEPLLQRAFTLRQHYLGSDHPRTAASLHNLARLFQKRGKVEEAIRMAEQALRILEQRAGVDRLILVRVLATLGALYQEQEKDAQAEAFFLRALAIQEHYLGQEHPDTANTLSDLARFRRRQHKLDEAIACTRRSLAIRTKVQGEMHPETVAEQTFYAELCREQEQAAVDGEVFPEQKSNATVFSESETIQDFFVRCCKLHPLACCRISDLWHAYEQWSASRLGQVPLSRRAFAAQVQAHGCRTDRTSKARIWRGIELLPQVVEQYDKSDRNDKMSIRVEGE